MKNTTRQKKLHKQPSDKTRWAYWMQAIEPKSEAINMAFPGYQPQWVQQSQMLTIGAANFINLRKALGMSKEQCAAYLRAGYSTVCAWEIGSSQVPFMAFELLRLVLESVKFKMTNAAWDGWFISDKGVLVSPNSGGNGFTPEQLDWLSWQQNEAVVEAKALREEVTGLKAELDEARAENIKLRQMFVAQGVVDELAAMQDTISELMSRIATAKVIPFPAIPIDQAKEKAA